jgi:predicted ATPase/serine/threonine protein kinase
LRGAAAGCKNFFESETLNGAGVRIFAMENDILAHAVQSRLESLIPQLLYPAQISQRAETQSGQTRIMSLAAGTRLGRYEIHSLLGEGGMGEVYLAEDNQLERTVALKILHSEVASDPQRMRRFIQEAKTTSALNHPNILTVHEIGQTDSVHFIATEFIDGITLRERVARGKMKTLEALDVALQVAAALKAAHAAGIVHRDIKPENIMLRPDGYVKVLDFGIAKLTEKLNLNRHAGQDVQEFYGPPTMVEVSPINQGGSSDEAPTIFRGNTESGVLVGTARYMSPEQARGFKVDARTDIFSFGAVLYEMLTGRVAFTGRDSSEIIAHLLKSEPPPLSQNAPDVPLELEQIINRALAKGRAQRYQSVQEMMQDLASLRQELEFKAKLNSKGQQSAGDEKTPSTRSANPPDSAQARGGVGFQPGVASLEIKNNIPVQPTLLIGREEELALIRQLLSRSDVRLLTLTGPGGAGKTRLGVEAASSLLDEFPDGAAFVALASINAPELVLPAIAQTFGIKQSGAQPLIEALKETLRGRRLLLLIDNFEQVLAAAPVVAELLTHCPELKVLATSRAPLHLRGEREFEVPPLALPDLTEAESVETLSQYAAIALFVERAVSIQPEFALTEENVRAVAEVCIRLDGLPLAIELVAARLKLLSPADILTRLEHSLSLLTGGARDLPARQQTMRGTISWSYDLLDESEKRLFRRLSVFVGGCTLSAVEAICGDALGIEVLDGLASLVDKSMLRQKEQAKNEKRFKMFETIREFGHEQLLTSGELELLQRGHALFFLELVERAEPLLTGPEQVVWLERMESEHHNLRAALRWAKTSKEKEIGLRLAATMWRFWEVRGYQSEGRDWLLQMLEESDDASNMVRARAFLRAGGLERDQGNYEQALRLFQNALTLYQRLGDKWGIAATLNGLGDMAQQRGNYAEATAHYEDALVLFKELGNQQAVSYVLNNLGNVARDEGDYERALEIHEEALALFRNLGDKRALATSLFNLGEVAQYKGDYGRAAELQNESLALKREVGDKRGITFSLANLGDIARHQGAYKRAAGFYAESLTLCREIGDKRGVAFCLEGLAEVACTQNAFERAAQLFGAAEALREAIGAPLPGVERADYERNVKSTRAGLSEETFREQWAQGREMPLERAIAYALEWPKSV